MGRFAKNFEIKSASYSVRAPYAPASVGPNAPVDGLIRFNTTIKKPQYFAQGQWRNFALEGAVSLLKDTFQGDGVERVFGPMLRSYLPGDELKILVFIGQVFQNPNVHYQVNNDLITFNSPPNDQQPIIIIHGLGSTTVEY